MERSFEHVLDCGGARRTTLRGRENIRKRYLIQAACANLSLLMRHLTGLGTPKQALAASLHALEALIPIVIRTLLDPFSSEAHFPVDSPPATHRFPNFGPLRFPLMLRWANEG